MANPKVPINVNNLFKNSKFEASGSLVELQGMRLFRFKVFLFCNLVRLACLILGVGIEFDFQEWEQKESSENE